MEHCAQGKGGPRVTSKFTGCAKCGGLKSETGVSLGVKGVNQGSNRV